MTTECYILRNNLTEICDGILLFRNDELAKRQVTAMMSARFNADIDEYNLYHIGTFDDVNLTVTGSVPHVVPFDKILFDKYRAHYQQQQQQSMAQMPFHLQDVELSLDKTGDKADN